MNCPGAKWGEAVQAELYKSNRRCEVRLPSPEAGVQGTILGVI